MPLLTCIPAFIICYLHDWIILLGDSIAAVRSLSLLLWDLTVVLWLSCLRDGWQMWPQPYWRDGSPP